MDWIAESKSHEMWVRDFSFASGERLDIKLFCRTLGTPREGPDNVVLLLHGTSGDSRQFLDPETADYLFSEGCPLSRSSYFIIMPDAIGHGHSSKPSTGSGTQFPKYSYTDIIVAQRMVVQELFHVDRLRLVLGTSMGGMQTWMWGIHYPKQMDALMPIACLPEKLRGFNLIYRRLMLAMIRPSLRSAADGVHDQSTGVGLAWNLFRLVVASQEELSRRFQDPDAVDQHIQQTAESASASQDATDVIWEFEASRDYDPNPHLGVVEASLLTVNFADDMINAPGFERLKVDMLRVPRGGAVTIDSGAGGHGHQTLAKAEVWCNCVRQVLAMTSRAAEPANGSRLAPG